MRTSKRCLKLSFYQFNRTFLYYWKHPKTDKGLQMSYTLGKLFMARRASEYYRNVPRDVTRHCDFDALDLLLQLLINSLCLHPVYYINLFNKNFVCPSHRPLAEDVSNWLYVIRATDKEGASEQDQLTVQVQQHRLERVINHEFALNLRIEKPQEYPHYVDWSLKILRALGRVYNTNMSEITVRHINYTSEPVVFVWSNDSLATNVCERSEIQELFKVRFWLVEMFG